MKKEMSIKTGKVVVCWVRDNKIVYHEDGAEKKKFEVLGFGKLGDDKTYLLEVPDEWKGWSISKFHVEHCGAFPAKISHKFNEVHVLMILEVERS